MVRSAKCRVQCPVQGAECGVQKIVGNLVEPPFTGD
ncbi:MAG: hypothetical protein DFNUSKGM_001807, partial [Candidatus Fervidibacter sacchari]